MKPVKYVGPFDTVMIDVYGLDVECAHGATVEVPEQVAGRPPKGDPAKADGSPNPNYDPGEGLLAQTDNWKPSKAAKSTEGDS